MEELKMQHYSLGRFDFSLPELFEPTGRNQSIYTVEVETCSYRDESPASLWQKQLDRIKADHASVENPRVIVWKGEVSPGFPAASYRTDMDLPVIIYTAQKAFKDHLLVLTCEGRMGFEKDILYLIALVAEGYKTGISYGFNVGYGSVISQPSVYEHAFAGFRNAVVNTEISINTQTVGEYFSDHPLEDVAYEKESLASNGIELDVMKDRQRMVAGREGYEGLVTVHFPDEGKIFRYTWFFQGESSESFSPEILIKMTVPENFLENMKETWEVLLDSFRVRRMD